MFGACAFATIAFAQYAAVLFLPSGEDSVSRSRYRERYRGRGDRAPEFGRTS